MTLGYEYLRKLNLRVTNFRFLVAALTSEAAIGTGRPVHSVYLTVGNDREFWKNG